MREVGLLEVTTDARGEVGRPQHRYSLAPDAPSLGPRTADDADAGPHGAGHGPAPRRQPGRRRRRRRDRGRGAGRSATPTPRRRSRRSSPTSTASASTRSSPTARRRRRAPTRRRVTAVVAFANCPFADLAARPPRPRLRPPPRPGRRVRGPDGRRRGGRVLLAGPPHALPGGGHQPLVLEHRDPQEEPPVITLTETAAVKVKELLTAEGADDLALRVAVRPGGCSGFSYEMFFDGDVAADDEQAEFGPSVKVVVDAASAQLLAGRHARLQGRPRPVRVRHHEPQRQPHLRLRPELLLTPLTTATSVGRMNKPLGPYSPFVRAGDFIIVSGQGGMLDGAIVDGGVAAQTTQTMANVADRLAEAGAALGDVVKTLCFLTDMGDVRRVQRGLRRRVRRPPPGPLDRRGVGAPRRDGRRGRGLGLQAGMTSPRPSASAAAGPRRRSGLPRLPRHRVGRARPATPAGCSSS